MAELIKKPLFNPQGDTEVNLRRMIGGNTTNLNDFNNMKYAWVIGWYRQAMNNFWIPEEINMSSDIKDYPELPEAERDAFCCTLDALYRRAKRESRAGFPETTRRVAQMEENGHE